MKNKKQKHCRYWQVCELYNAKNNSCNEDEGFYGNNLAGCYKSRAKIEEENKKKRKKKK